MPPQDLALQRAHITIEAVITHPDGSVEDLGVIASTDDGNVTITPETKD